MGINYHSIGGIPMDADTFQKAFTEVFKLNSPNMIKKADSDTRIALKGLHRLVEEEKRGLSKNVWLEDYQWEYETAIALGFVQVDEPSKPGRGIHEKVRYLSPTTHGRQIHELLVREGYHFAPPDSTYTLRKY